MLKIFKPCATSTKKSTSAIFVQFCNYCIAHDSVCISCLKLWKIWIVHECDNDGLSRI